MVLANSEKAAVAHTAYATLPETLSTMIRSMLPLLLVAAIDGRAFHLVAPD